MCFESCLRPYGCLDNIYFRHVVSFLDNTRVSVFVVLYSICFRNVFFFRIRVFRKYGVFSICVFNMFILKILLIEKY